MRTTPDPNRKSYSSGLSLSSNTSYNSARNSGGSLQTRLSQTSSSSRLPTPKPRVEHVVAPEEEVPPVPAIPKAYESPKGDFEQPTYSSPFVMGRKSSLPVDIGLLKIKADTDSNPSSSVTDGEANGYDGREMKTPEAKPKPPAIYGKRNLQPLKLPPLNLLPLGTPMTTKIEALKDREDDAKPYTPTSQLMSKTPSTPLTASKANFFSVRDDDDGAPRTQARSSTSHFIVSTSSGANLRTASSSSALATFENTPGGARTVSPYISYTLPKSSSEFNYLRQKASGDYTSQAAQLGSYKLNGPRPQTQSSSLSQLSTPTDPDNSASETSLRSNITVARQRSNSRTQATADSKGDPQKYDLHKIINSARSSAAAAPRAPEPQKDADVVAADDEMRRLASKRKDLENAAKDLDALRRKAGPKERVGPAQALKMANLNIFERGEIIDFKDIYFCGTQNAKKHVGDLNAQAANFGYDDDRGDYNIVIGDHLAYRYEVINVLGKGSFGQVVRCIDHKTGGLVAVKIIRNKKRFHQQALIEVNLLQKLKEWDPHRRHSVVNFTQSFYFRGHLCISTELLGMNLYEFIKVHDFRGFSLKLIRRFTKQMLSTLTLLHAKKVIHCDLKPENILLVHPMSSEIRVIDFGSSCFENEKVYTYIQSRFYRSPEVILGMSYGMPIDMWSVGCILAELYTGYPIFPGENEQEQLACIMEVFGPPEKHLIEKSTRKKLFFDSLGKPRLTVSSKGRRRRPSSKDLRQVLKCDDEAFLDFISRCLRWDPARRLNPHDALRHEFITGIKAPPRSRTYPTASTPAKRGTTASNLTSGRPLPDPPKTGPFVRSRDVSGSSPVKPTSGKRHSTVSGLAPSTPAKRGTATTTAPGSALPRVAARSISGKPDLATAAAATSLNYSD
ncbi:hypothetical protein ATERTT37_002218 [Aspergillus terreus]